MGMLYSHSSAFDNDSGGLAMSTQEKSRCRGGIHDQRRLLAGDNCKQVSASPGAKTVLGNCARLTGFLAPMPEAEVHAQLAREVMQHVR